MSIRPLQKKTPGPQFGTNFGPETSGGKPQPVRSCPEVLEMRELCEHRPLGTAHRDAVDARLKVTRLLPSGFSVRQVDTRQHVFVRAGIHRGSDEQEAAVRRDGGERASL